MWIAAYQMMRIVKWLLWIGFVSFCFYFVSNRTPHLNQFGHLTIRTEIIMFGLPLAAMTAGLFELMFRDRAYPQRVLR
jgi:hypothetical protein